MAARPQWYFWSIGLTNSVQPYCRLAIITMQMMPNTSCIHRVASEVAASEVVASDFTFTASEIALMPSPCGFPSMVLFLLEAAPVGVLRITGIPVQVV